MTVACRNFIVPYYLSAIWEGNLYMSISVMDVGTGMQRVVYSNQQNSPQVLINRNVNGNHGASPRTTCSPISSPTSPNKWNTKRRRRVSSIPVQLQRQDAVYELVGVLAHSGNQAAGHYISFIKERRDEMASSASYGEWIEMNDTLVDQFFLTQMNMDKYWFGGKCW
uniref:USP domain-containing protein n=1 Tax=Heterorhabditis bacteriophora TaxID=37862 RepID=A0A1I7WJY2_HETBA